MPTTQKSPLLKVMLAILSFACLFTVFFWHNKEATSNLVEAESLSKSPDYFITEITVQTFDNNGVLIEHLQAQQASHFIQESKTLLDRPNVERHSTTGSWNATADSGIIHDGSNDILLTSNANATKTYPTSENIALSANKIHYLDNDQSLTSQGDAKLFSTQGTTSAKKITTYINSEKVVMTGLVQGHYETSH
ncbi:LPS export ABC transporter periplasmic protein LptC [Marinomonas sp.]|nr:LPS export ABC transporter periplasmic protein LptC [Marinomonas sp.]MDB4837481.1 LPS export ABC transporter periplasmic protein LptC [Marinomonas sp.]